MTHFAPRPAEIFSSKGSPGAGMLPNHCKPFVFPVKCAKGFAPCGRECGFTPCTQRIIPFVPTVQAVPCRAGPWVEPWFLGHPGTHGIKFHVGQGSQSVGIVTWAGVEAILPKVTSSLMTLVEVFGVEEMAMPDGLYQRYFRFWDHHEMDVIGHETVAFDLQAKHTGVLLNELQIREAVRVVQEDILPIVSSLCHMVACTGHNNTRSPRHGRRISHSTRPGDWLHSSRRKGGVDGIGAANAKNGACTRPGNAMGKGTGTVSRGEALVACLDACRETEPVPGGKCFWDGYRHRFPGLGSCCMP